MRNFCDQSYDFQYEMCFSAERSMTATKLLCTRRHKSSRLNMLPAKHMNAAIVCIPPKSSGLGVALPNIYQRLIPTRHSFLPDTHLDAILWFPIPSLLIPSVSHIFLVAFILRLTVNFLLLFLRASRIEYTSIPNIIYSLHYSILLPGIKQLKLKHNLNSQN